LTKKAFFPVAGRFLEVKNSLRAATVIPLSLSSSQAAWYFSVNLSIFLPFGSFLEAWLAYEAFAPFLAGDLAGDFIEEGSGCFFLEAGGFFLPCSFSSSSL
jgi:hypothetical protein